MEPDSHASPPPTRRAQAGTARLAAAQSIYQMMTSGCSVDEAARIYLDRFAGMDVDGEKLVAPDRALYVRLVRGVAERTSDLEDLLTGHLTKAAPETDPEPTTPRRIDLLLRAILVCGLYELLACPQTDTPVVISEYLHVTRAFYDGRETALVNAVLDAAARTLRPDINP